MIKIIDYKAGNAPSVLHAINYLSQGPGLGHKVELAKSPADLLGAGCIILPGVGSAKATMESLAELDILGPLEEAVLGKKIPFLGICIGMQILFDHSQEDDVRCLGWLPGKVVKYDSTGRSGAGAVRVPQMGWNKVSFVKDTSISAKEDYFYFVNSYHAHADYTDVWGQAEYGGTFTAAVCRDNIYGMQFHVEKSGEAGLKLLDDFVRWG